MLASLRFPVLLASLALLLYLPSLGHELQVSWDDNRYITENEWVKDPTLAHLGKIVTEVHFGAYLPVTLLSYALDTVLFGGTSWGYHTTNVLLHAANTFLVYLVLFTLLRNRDAALLGTLFFLVHPVQVESVSWVSQRKNLLSMFFMLLTFLVHARRVSGVGGRGFFLVELVTFMLAVFAKPIVVGGPAVLLAYDILYVSRPPGRAFIGVLPHGLISLAGVYLILTAHSEVGGIKEPLGRGVTGFLLLGTRVLFDYAVSLVLPFNLDCNYIYRMEWIRGAPLALAGGALVAAGLSYLAMNGVRSFFLQGPALQEERPDPVQDPALGLFAVIWMVIFILPVSNIVPIAIQRADRYLYLPSVLIAGMLGAWIHQRWERHPGERSRHGLVAAVAGALSVLTLLTVQRQAVWRDDATLWKSHLAHHPTSQTGILNVGVYHWRRGELIEAKYHFERLAGYFPDFPKAHQFMGRVHFREKAYAKAAGRFAKAQSLERDPAIGELEGLAWFNAGLELSQAKRYTEALAMYSRALQILPRQPPLHNNIGFAYYNLGDFDRAIEAYQVALGLDPGYAKARAYLARALEARAKAAGGKP